MVMPALRAALRPLLRAHFESREVTGARGADPPYVLSQEQLRRWRKDGFLVLKVRLPRYLGF